MQFEFQESDVVFGDGPSSYEEDGHGASLNKSGKSKKRLGQGGNSPPVDIPHNVRRLYRDFEDHFEEGEEGRDDEGERVPPHVIVDRRWTYGRVACSVCFSHGRTLKGRCLSEVRNSILRMTGFLES